MMKKRLKSATVQNRARRHNKAKLAFEMLEKEMETIRKTEELRGIVGSSGIQGPGGCWVYDPESGWIYQLDGVTVTNVPTVTESHFGPGYSSITMVMGHSQGYEYASDLGSSNNWGGTIGSAIIGLFSQVLGITYGVVSAGRAQQISNIQDVLYASTGNVIVTTTLTGAGVSGSYSTTITFSDPDGNIYGTIIF